MDRTTNSLHSAYFKMAVIRRFEERIHIENERGNVPGFIHLYAGQEACAVGVCSVLNKTDMISSTHRGHGHCIAKGCDIEAMMLELFARDGGICGAKAGSQHMADLDVGMLGANGIVGAGNPLICGAALAAKVLGDGRIAVSFMGDGATNQGATLESLNLAVVWNLPAVFVVEDNGYAETTSSSWSIGGGDLIKRAEGFGMRGFGADGFDYFAVAEVAAKAAAHARRGEGPALLHLSVGRYFGHFEGDAATYRPKGEVERLRADRDCLRGFRDRVTAEGILCGTELDAIDAEVTELIERCVQSAMRSPPPSAASLLRDVYGQY